MGSVTRIASALAVLVGLSVGVAYTQPTFLSDLGMDVWKLPEMNKKLNTENNRSEKLDQDLTKFQDLSKSKRKIIQDLADGSMSLAEAITFISEIDEGNYVELAMSVLNMDQSNSPGGVGRLLIFWVQDHLRNQPDLAEEAHTRLDEELEELETITQ